jgi:allantoicase
MNASAGVPRISVFRCTPLSQKEPLELNGKSTFEVKIMERHLHTNQVFVPMGTGVLMGHEEDKLAKAGRAYLVIVAQNGTGKS